MKYIRTKDGVYDTSKGIYTPSIKMWAIGIVTIYDEDILSQSENLEELCDEFVIDDKRNNTHYLMDYDDVIEEIYCGRIYDGDTIYGAIWTDKGLIYVAKMDSEGKLVLI